MYEINFSSIKGVLFDFDGVIVDSVSLHHESIVRTAQAFGFEFPDSEYEKMQGRTGRENFLHLTKTYGEGRQFDLEAILEHNRQAYVALAEEKLLLVPGAVEFAGHCLSSGKKIAIASTARKTNMEMALEKFGLSETFPIRISSSEIIKGKPDPEVFQKAAGLLGLETSDCMVIEDAINGIMAGKNAGCFTIGITTSVGRDKLESEGADMVVDSFEELEKIIAP